MVVFSASSHFGDLGSRRVSGIGERIWIVSCVLKTFEAGDFDMVFLDAVKKVEITHT